MSVPFGQSQEQHEQALQGLAEQLAKQIKSEQDITALSKQLLKLTVESALQGELEEHLGYRKHAVEGRGSGNSRNGHSKKTVKSNLGEIELHTPRDRQGSFEPQLIGKGQRRLTQMDDQILTLYAKGMTTRDIADTFKEMYGADVSHTLIANVTEAVYETVKAWQARPLDRLYPIVYLDALVVKVHQERRVINKTIHVVLGINRHLEFTVEHILRDRLAVVGVGGGFEFTLAFHL